MIQFKKIDYVAVLLVTLLSAFSFEAQEIKPAKKLHGEMPLFEVENPDFETSPHTGMTKKHWEDAAQYLLEGAFSYIDNLDDPMKFPKLPGKSYPHDIGRVPTEKLEGLVRTLFVAAPLLKKNPDLTLNGIKVAEYYQHQIPKLIDPESPAYIKPRGNGGPSQNLVEYGALAISLFISPETLWEPLSQENKDGLAESMLSYGDGPTVPSNWKFFNIFVLSFFDAQGYDVNKSLLEEYLNKSLADYRGQGWYNDNPAYDYYSMWAFQVYGPMWATVYGDENYPEIAKAFKTNFQDLVYHYPYMFAEDGKMIMFGRSISYRIASISPFPFTGTLQDDTINFGWLRRISSGTLLQFLQNPDFLLDRIPTLGFYGHFEPAVQVYSARGSVYWMGKAFLGLLVPDDNPFWTAVENEGPWDATFEKGRVYNKYQSASNILITDYPNLGASEIRAWCHERKADDWQGFRSSENYNKLSYNSAFPWQADGKKGEISMNYVFLNEKEEWEPWRLYTFKKYEDGIYYRDAVLETNDQVSMQLAEMPLPNGILRVDKQTSTVPVKMRLGHYALPKLDGKEIKQSTKKVNGKTVTIIDNGEYQLALVPLMGWEKTEFVSASGLNPVSAKSTTINVATNFWPQAKTNIYATLMLWKKSGENWNDEELMPVEDISVNDNTVAVLMLENELHTINFD
ncbi:DUF2264 domain-containing protein [Leeuwenhoekiella marinoflava]|uniref:DUF2264 domain-containing protein n=2 Tax=Leeuwenhoekiella marinoflava TaxID=988 RepID=A0A4Q0PIU6_9FLAO|nr:DUF2264 domain-containing protein [Leeuwenhoekiella marinoflava]RXG27185.1 putative protein DUF2264 [Leeuwenhoekiella marinoflava]SHF78007.1 hypothetical protein SAMN02745246_03373 [Leeuwenhoekiella marinoflava DSM 3653]